MLKTLRTVLYIFIVFFVTLFLLEDACQIYVRFMKPELMPKYEQLQNPPLEQTATTIGPKFKPSPFFGYVSSEGNNYGFISNEDFPIARTSNTYVVAILGGSVAFHLSNYILKHPDFKDQMKKAIPALKDKDIRFMGLALPGYKQPQQQIILSYFLEHIDMAIQVDGWNEVFVAAPSEAPNDYPLQMDLGSAADFEKISPSSRLKFLMIKTIEENNLLKKSMALFLFKNSLEYKMFQEKHKKYGSPAVAPPIFSQNPSPLVATWSKFIKQEKSLLKGGNKKGFFFVQASQYNPHSKVLTDEEKKIALNPLIAKLVAPKFQMIRSEAKKINVYDLAEVFKNETVSIYVDNCCHVNDRGNKLITDEILRVISKNFSE